MEAPCSLGPLQSRTRGSHCKMRRGDEVRCHQTNKLQLQLATPTWICMGHVKRLSSSLLLSLTQPLLLRAMATVTGTISRLVKVRSLQGEEKLNLILDDPHGHHREMLRDKHEHVGKALKRMVLQSMKSFKGGKRTRKLKGASEKTNADETPPISARLYTPTGELVKESVPNTVAWEEGSILELGSVRYKVCVNIPTILSVILPKFVMTGCPVVPKVHYIYISSYMEQYACGHIANDSEVVSE